MLPKARRRRTRFFSTIGALTFFVTECLCMVCHEIPSRSHCVVVGEYQIIQIRGNEQAVNIENLHTGFVLCWFVRVGVSESINHRANRVHTFPMFTHGYRASRFEFLGVCINVCSVVAVDSVGDTQLNVYMYIQ